MAKSDNKDKAEKPDKAEKAEKAEKGERPPKGERPGKAEKAAKSEPIERGVVSAKPPKDYVPRLKREFREKVTPEMQTEFNYKNPMQVPRLQKIVINMGVGEGSRDAKVLQRAEEDLTLIAGQKPKRTYARVSVSAFKVREGMPCGCIVTLRGTYMYEFLERLISIAIPRIRDFRGLPPKSFDGRGNYNFGLKEHHVFLELDTSKEMMQFGMDIAFVTSAKTDAECKALLKSFGLPLRDIDAKN